jgi:hypothetical protein
MKSSATESLVDLANSYVPVTKVLSWFNIFVPDIQPGRSWKAVCPFGEIYHLGRSIDKTMRVYSDTNSAYCFDGCGYLSPVAMYSKLKGLSLLEAAEELLDRQGFQARSQEDIWLELSLKPREVDHLSLGSALQEYCTNIFGPSWNMRQLDKAYSEVLDRCLKLLDLVTTEQEAKEWLEATKSIMRKLSK